MTSSPSDPPTFGAQADAAPLWFSAPARMPLGLSIGVVTAGGHMHLAFRYHHHRGSAWPSSTVTSWCRSTARTWASFPARPGARLVRSSKELARP